MTSKTVLFNEMKTISIEDARNINASWGIDANHLNNWFQYDADRKNKTKFISIEIKNSAIRPAITPEDVDKAFSVLRNHFM
jgi:CRISPR/Cas system CMR-associated protein Cmr5 small subunit